MNQPRSLQTTAAELSCLIHLLLVLVVVLVARYAVDPETPPLVIDFTLATVSPAHADTGPPPGTDMPKPATSSVLPPTQKPELPTKKPVPAPKKAAKVVKPAVKPKPKPQASAPAPKEPMAMPTLANSAATETAATETAAAAATAGPDSDSQHETAATGTGMAGEPSRGDQGAGGAGGGIPYSYEYVRRLLTDNLHFPAIARKMGLSGRIVVAFYLKKDGQVAEIAITSSSGHAILDDEVVATLRRIAPLPRPPAAARLVVPIVFNLRR